ncbi:MAG: GNAT family N-acetyltransferase [Treponema sp.]|nr:GNAT family N-acetyltransferase [Treponema sp.]
MNTGHTGEIAVCRDAALIADILRKSFITVADEFGYTINNASYFTAFITNEKVQKQLDAGFYAYIFTEDGQPAGTIGWYSESGKYIIERLAVLPEYRHRNIGKQLMEFAGNQIKKAGGNLIQLSLVDNNAQLKKWYQNLGYKITEIKDKQLAFKIAVMEKQLTVNITVN